MVGVGIVVGVGVFVVGVDYVALGVCGICVGKAVTKIVKLSITWGVHWGGGWLAKRGGHNNYYKPCFFTNQIPISNL